MKILHSRVAAVAAGATVLAVVGAGGTYAASQITGDDIKNGTVTTKDVQNHTLIRRDLSDGALRHLQGQQGPPGEQGPPGQSLVANETTAPNAGYPGNPQVVSVPSEPATSGGPTPTSGAELVDPVTLDAGTYLVSSTVQFFDFESTGGTNDEDYGVARLFLDDQRLAESWTGQVPDDGNNAAQASGSLVVTVPSGGGTLTARALLRGGDDGEAGGNLIVTRSAGSSSAG